MLPFLRNAYLGQNSAYHMQDFMVSRRTVQWSGSVSWCVTEISASFWVCVAQEIQGKTKSIIC